MPIGNDPGNLHEEVPPVRKVLLPNSLSELWSCLKEAPEAPVFAGGTDLFVQMHQHQQEPPALIGLERISELQGVRKETDGLWIGACTTHSHLLNDPRIGQHLPVLARALETLGSPPIRNMGTLGGNICTASPAGDTLPPLIVLDAEVELCTARDRRVMPLRSFIVGPGKTRIERGEILTAVRVNIPVAYNLHHFEKIGQRKAMACAIASLAALIRRSPVGSIEAIRLAWGSVGPTVVTAPNVEAMFIGERLSPTLLEKAALLVRQGVTPIDDVRATAGYRREVSGNLLLRLAASPPPDNPI
jgi:CO/xanthine dehydrogenase FAD-binding subunit